MGIVASLFLTAATTLAVVSTSGGSAPVKIKSCDVAYITQSGIMTSQLQFTNGVTVSAQNVSSKPVSSFTVHGSYNKFSVTDTWTGSLLPNASVSVWKHYTQLAWDGSKAKCDVIKVTFADGSQWTETP